MAESTLLLAVTPDLAGHVAVALKLYLDQQRRSYRRLPDGYDELLAHMTTAARRRQEPTTVDGVTPDPDAVGERRMLFTYEEAAQMCAVSRRAIERLVDAGDLEPVRIGASRRIRLEDLEAFVSSRKDAP